MHQDYLAVNKTLWNERVHHHVDSDFYKMDAFLQGATSLNDLELKLLGDVRGKSILHLQCHFGQDTLSLARMGATVTGVDLSDTAITKAIALNETLGLNATFICTDIYSLPRVLNQQFDIVFTSYGTIGWLPDMKQWAMLVAKYLKPGGQFVFAEFHPVVWMFDSEFTKVQYSYFNKETIEETESGTYTDSNAPISLKSISWNHDLAEVMQNLLNAGLRITDFVEQDFSPYKCFHNTVETAPGIFQITGMEGKIPMVYAIKAFNG